MLSIQHRLRPKLFPHDFSDVSHHGLHLSPHSFCFYRLCMLLLIMALFTLLLLYGPETSNWAYLTYWGFTGTLVYFFLATTESMMMRVFGNRLGLPLWKLLHLMFQNLLCVEIVINGVFWFAFFPFIVYASHKNHKPLKTIDIVQAIGAHVVPLVLLLVDMCNNLICFWNKRSRKMIVITLLIYLAFNMVYTFVQGPIYPILTYQDLLSYVFVACNVIGTLVAYEIVFILSHLFKNKKVLQVLKTKRREEQMEEVEREITELSGKKSQKILLVQDCTNNKTMEINGQEA